MIQKMLDLQTTKISGGHALPMPSMSLRTNVCNCNFQNRVVIFGQEQEMNTQSFLIWPFINY